MIGLSQTSVIAIAMRYSPQETASLEARAFTERLISRRVMLGMAQKVENGGWPGQGRLGYSNVYWCGKRIIEVDREVAPLILRAFYMAEEPGILLRTILADVTQRGLRSKHGKPLGISALWKILTDPFYIGMLQYKGKLFEGKHQPLITKECFDTVQANLAARRRR